MMRGQIFGQVWTEKEDRQEYIRTWTNYDARLKFGLFLFLLESPDAYTYVRQIFVLWKRRSSPKIYLPLYIVHWCSERIELGISGCQFVSIEHHVVLIGDCVFPPSSQRDLTYVACAYCACAVLTRFAASKGNQYILVGRYRRECKRERLQNNTILKEELVHPVGGYQAVLWTGHQSKF